MANERTTVVSMTVSKGGASINTGTKSKTSDMSGVDMATWTQSVGTSNEALDLPGDLTGDVCLVVTNNDSTNFVEIFEDNGNANLLSKLLPGESCYLSRVPHDSLFARADTAAVQVQCSAGEA